MNQGDKLASNKKLRNIIIVIFVLRGIAFQCIYPPMEGPDEYQHIAYMIYLQENQQIPIFGEAFVPEKIYPELIRFPHSKFALDQVRGIGCLGYDEFYDQTTRMNTDKKILLYQAQHPPLYYLIFSPFFLVIYGISGFLPAIYTMRIFNTIIAAFAAWLLLKPVRMLFENQITSWLIHLTFFTLPMYLVYSSRISNDALALLFCGAGVASILEIGRSLHSRRYAALAGVWIGLGLWSKLIAIAFLPAIYAYLCTLLLKSKNKKLIITCIALFTIFYAFTAIPFHFSAMNQYGTMFPSQLTIRSHSAGMVSSGLFDLMDKRHLLDFFLGTMIRDNLWLSGWSFLKPKGIFISIYFIALLICFLGMIPGSYLLFRSAKARSKINVKLDVLVICLSIVAFTSGAAYIHALHKIKIIGFFATPPYYFMAAFPSLLACLFYFARGYGKHIVQIIALFLIVLFVVVETHSLLFIGVPMWTNANSLSVITQRLNQIHPIFPSPYFYFPIYGAAMILTIWFLVIAYKSGKSRIII